MSCLCFLFISLDQLSQYLPDQWSPNLQVARIMAVNERSEVSFFFDPSRVVALATNFCYFYRLLTTELGSRVIR